MSKRSRVLTAAGVMLMLASGVAYADDAAAQTYLAENGCVVGPQERMAPGASGIHPRLREIASAALAEGRAERQGDWIVLGPEACTMRPPVIETAFDATSPAVQRSISDIDAHAEIEQQGCFIDSETLQTELMAQDGLSAAEAAVAYYAVLADGVINQQMSFFSDDILRTPAGFQLLTGACAGVPQIEDIRRSQALMLEHFDALVRDNARRVRCEENASPVSVEVAQTLSDLTDGASVNQWTMMDLMLIALGAGWVEGISDTERGTPRPPICSHVG